MLLAKFPVLASWTHRKMKGLPLNYPNYDLPYTENLAYMMFRMPNKEFKVSKTLVNALNKFVAFPASIYEKSEKLEQLRALDFGLKIHVTVTDFNIPPGVDTPTDLDAVRALIP